MRSVKRKVPVCGLAICWLFAGCGGRKPAPKAPEKAVERPKATGVAKGVSVFGRDAQGRPLYEVRTLRSTQSEVAASATLTDTRVTLYHNGVKDLVVSAPSARVDVKTKDLFMWGGLAARSSSSAAGFRVDRMTWNAGTRLFIGTGNARYSRSPVTISADRLSGRTPLTHVNMDGNVRMSVSQNGTTEGRGATEVHGG